MAKRANGEGSITYKLRYNKKYYTGTITVGTSNNTQERKTKSSYKKSEVVEWMNQIKAQTYTENSEVTLSDYIKNWMIKYKKPTLKKSSYIRYEQYYRLHIKPYPISEMTISDITSDNLQTFFNDLREKTSSSSTTDSIYRVFKTVFKRLRDDGSISRNPMLNVEVKHHVKEHYPVFTINEQKSIISHLNLNNLEDIGIYIDFATGLRLSELLALTDESIIKNEIQVRNQYRRNGKDYELTSLKTKTALRNIPVPEKIKPILDKLRKRKGYLFSENGKTPIDRKRLQRRFKRLQKDLNIDPHPFHSIRHSYSTRLYENNVPIKTIQALMGHSDYATTLNIYTHVSDEMKKDSVNVLDDIL